VRILIVGSGAREHAIARSLAAEGADHELVVAPGNAGIAALARTEPLAAEDPDEVVALAQRLGSELVVIGPEAPLVAGVADALRERGIPVFGPGKDAAALEGSKAFAKRIMAEAGVPTGRAVDVRTAHELDGALDATGSPYVVKADGLAAGKGVLVTEDRDAARAHALHWLETGPVLVEEFLRGREVSLFFVSDGSVALPLSPAQDFKRLEDSDAGPNTGGMGAYSPLPWLTEAFGSSDASAPTAEERFVEQVRETVAAPVIAQLAAEGTPFSGLLYCGLVVDGTSVKVIEFNARFGDPETQVVLPRLASPLSALLHGAAVGSFGDLAAPRFLDDAAVGVVLASAGYPERPVLGAPIVGLDQAEAQPSVHVDHAATAQDGAGLIATGGRVLTVVGLGADVAAARAAAYRGVDRIGFPGAQRRTDIAEGIA
jgi:phosphoribosylamine--glycine ligase